MCWSLPRLIGFYDPRIRRHEFKVFCFVFLGLDVLGIFLERMFHSWHRKFIELFIQLTGFFLGGYLAGVDLIQQSNNHNNTCMQRWRKCCQDVPDDFGNHRLRPPNYSYDDDVDNEPPLLEASVWNTWVPVSDSDHFWWADFGELELNKSLLTNPLKGTLLVRSVFPKKDHFKPVILIVAGVGFHEVEDCCLCCFSMLLDSWKEDIGYHLY